ALWKEEAPSTSGRAAGGRKSMALMIAMFFMALADNIDTLPGSSRKEPARACPGDAKREFL
ncbi:MAG TPA: hypothetical protein VMU36_04115, partial [Spirochaetia bacterium]|nr:hypothetical protein [Spirochaetia bacterium]